MFMNEKSVLIKHLTAFQTCEVVFIVGKNLS